MDSNARELRFRAWHKINKTMGDVASLTREWQTEYTLIKYEGKDLVTAYKTNELEIIQYTGLKDKNGKKIYEGDILEIDGGGSETSKGEVSFKDGCFIFKADWINVYKGNYPELKAYTDKSFCEVEIIGNIYQNPDLLKEQK